MKKLIAIIALGISVMSLTGCGREDYEVGSTEVAYLYTTDINESQRIDPGSNYYRQWPFQEKRQILKIDYGVETRPFNATYTLPAKQKISIDVEAEIMFRLEKSSGKPDFKDDALAQFYSSTVAPTRVQGSSNTKRINPNAAYAKLMAETQDKAFRTAFTDVKSYPDFDTLESSIIDIQDRIKSELKAQAEKEHIVIVGLKIKDIPVPDPIQNARNESLKLDQDLVNQQKALEIKRKLAAEQQAIEVRDSLNDVTKDMIASRTDKGYLLVKAIKQAAENGSPINVSFTPDFMRYLEDSGAKNKAQTKESNELYNKLRKMNDEQLLEYFKQGNK